MWYNKENKDSFHFISFIILIGGLTMSNNKSNLAINNEAIAKIAAMATLEVEGVAELGKRPIELKNVKSVLSGARTKHSNAIGIVIDNGAIMFDIFVKINDTAKLKDVADNVQKNVKDKVQSMTGNAVARVNVHIEDLCITEE